LQKDIHRAWNFITNHAQITFVLNLTSILKRAKTGFVKFFEKRSKKGLTVLIVGPINRSTPPDGDTLKRRDAGRLRASEGRDYEGNFGC